MKDDAHSPKPLSIRDSDGNSVTAGDTIVFNYGIPPVRVTAKVIAIDGVLWALTPGHKPERAKLASLRRYVEHFWKIDN